MKTKLVYIVSFIVLLFLVCCKAGKKIVRMLGL